MSTLTTPENILFGLEPATTQSQLTMRALLRNILAQECDKHIQRYNEYLKELHEESVRRSKRLDTPPEKIIRTPPYWTLAAGFNPFKTRIARKLDLYSVALADAIRQGAYKPKRAVRHHVSKEDGTLRELDIFQLPDAAVSRLAYKSLLHKNVTRFSSYAYAYREDRGSHDALREVFLEWKNLDRLYTAEFDFTKFFDNISHEYIWSSLQKRGFLVTSEERDIIEGFLTSECADSTVYHDMTGQFVREKGIPQGTAVSLFLANLACWDLDRALERIGVGFSRYADDTLVWSESYAQVVLAYDVIRRFGDLMAVPLNLDKSKGISLVTRDKPGEIESKLTVDYLGYRLGLSNIAITERRVQKLKKKISFVVYQNLLQPLKHGVYNVKRLKDLDWDYVVALSQIRRYLYGGLNDLKLRQYIRGQITRVNFRGLMSYYPLVTDERQLRELDGWLIYILHQTLKRRQALWTAKSGIMLPGPKPDWIENISQLKTWTDAPGRSYDLRIPSFSLINKAMQIALSKSGIKAVAHPGSGYY